MQALRQWVLLFCSGCILYGLLENLLPRRGVYPVIKTVAVLYILLVLLSPAGSLGAAALPQVPAAPSAAESAADDSGFWELTAKTLRQDLAGQLAARGWQSEVLAARLQARGAQLAVTLWLRLAEGEDAEALCRLCDSLLGVPAAYRWEGEALPPAA